jgi:hypothetical protein
VNISDLIHQLDGAGLAVTDADLISAALKELDLSMDTQIDALFRKAVTRTVRVQVTVKFAGAFLLMSVEKNGRIHTHSAALRKQSQYRKVIVWLDKHDVIYKPVINTYGTMGWEAVFTA